jgi:hypothetical protein
MGVEMIVRKRGPAILDDAGTVVEMSREGKGYRRGKDRAERGRFPAQVSDRSQIRELRDNPDCDREGDEPSAMFIAHYDTLRTLARSEIGLEKLQATVKRSGKVVDALVDRVRRMVTKSENFRRKLNAAIAKQKTSPGAAA